MRKYALILILAVTGVAGMNAQITLAPTVIASAGGYSEAGNIHLSWTLGELAVTTLNGGNLILTQGFQQPYTLGTGRSPVETDWSITAYPNPVETNLRLKFDISESSDFLIEIQDVAGRLLSLEQYKKVYPGEVISIPMDRYFQGIYFFKVYTPDRRQVKVFSIRKI